MIDKNSTQNFFDDGGFSSSEKETRPYSTEQINIQHTFSQRLNEDKELNKFEVVEQRNIQHDYAQILNEDEESNKFKRNIHLQFLSVLSEEEEFNEVLVVELRNIQYHYAQILIEEELNEFVVIDQRSIQENYLPILNEDGGFSFCDYIIFISFIFFILVLYLFSKIFFKISTQKFILFFPRKTFIHIASEYPPTSISTKLFFFFMLLIVQFSFLIFAIFIAFNQ
jgi:hypothetical protein